MSPLLGCLLLSAQIGPLPVGRDVWGLALSPDGSTLAISHRSARITIFDVEGAGGFRFGAQPGPEGSLLTQLSLSPDGRFLVAGNVTAEAGPNPVWDTTTWKTGVPFGIRTSIDVAEPSSSARFSGDGQFIFGEQATVGALAAFDPSTGNPSFQMLPNASYPMAAWDAAPFDAFVAFVQEGLGQVQVWAPAPTATSDRWEERGLANRVPLPEGVHLLRFSPDGRWLALAARKGKAHILATLPLDPTADGVEVDLGDLDARAAAWYPDSRRLALAGLDGRIAIVDTGAARVLHAWEGHDGRHIRAALVAPDGLLVTGAAGAYSEKQGGQITWWDEAGHAKRSVAVPLSPPRTR